MQIKGFIGGAVLWLAVVTSDTQSLAAATRNRLTGHGPSSLFSNTVDWYAPPPLHVDSRPRIVIPFQLFTWIPPSRRQAAIKLLGENTVSEVNNAQAAELARSIDITGIVRNRIAEMAEQLRRVRNRARAEKAYRLMHLSDDEIRSKRRMDEATAQNLEAEIRQWRKWKGQLKPYLIKAVALEAGGSFSGILVDENLVVEHNAMASGPLPMERCPIIVYLPTKPRRIYTSIAMTR
jgi:hypothetical protein